MANWRYRRLLRQAWHPTDEELLLFVEGESDARSARSLSDHLSGCWTCRARRTEIERAIGAYMAYHRDPARTAVDVDGAGASGADDTEQATRRFAVALARAKDRPPQDAAPPFASVSAGEWRLGWALARGAAVVLAIVLVMRWWLAPPIVSARELMARVDRAQQQEIAAVADPVIYQRLHASRASSKDTVTWEVWASQRQRRLVERVSASSPLLLDLQEVLRENGMEPGQPLSAASLTAWRRFAGHVAEDVRETTLSDGAAAVTLTSSAPGPVAEGRIARSEVTVRTRDWHPVTHILTVAGAAGQQQRYTITELSYRVVPLETVDATIFNPPAIAAPLASDEPTATAEADAAPPPRAAHPASAAVRALYEEHTSGACLSDPNFPETPASGGSAGTGGGADAAMRHLRAIRKLAEWYRADVNGVERGSTRGLDRKSEALLAAMVREHLEAARHHLPSSSGDAERKSTTPEPAVEGGSAATNATAASPAAMNAAAATAPAAIETDAAGGEPWTTVAMKAYAAVEYVARVGSADAPGVGSAAGAAGTPTAADAARAGAPEATGATAGAGSDARQNVAARQDASASRDAVARARALLRSLDAAVQRFAPGGASKPAPAPSAQPAPGDAPRGVTPPQSRP